MEIIVQRILFLRFLSPWNRGVAVLPICRWVTVEFLGGLPTAFNREGWERSQRDTPGLGEGFAALTQHSLGKEEKGGH